MKKGLVAGRQCKGWNRTVDAIWGRGCWSTHIECADVGFARLCGKRMRQRAGGWRMRVMRVCNKDEFSPVLESDAQARSPFDGGRGRNAG